MLVNKQVGGEITWGGPDSFSLPPKAKNSLFAPVVAQLAVPRTSLKASVITY
jgi:hypothetical protein